MVAMSSCAGCAQSSHYCLEETGVRVESVNLVCWPRAASARIKGHLFLITTKAPSSELPTALRWAGL